MSSSKILSFLFCCSVLYVDVIATSPYTCKGNIYNITRSNNEEATNLFQRWLQWRQNQPDRCESGKVESSTQYGFGLGASILESIKKMLTAIETGRIYRPHSTWLWSEDQYPENCTMGVKVIDCFSLPLSQCFKVKEQFKILPYAFPDPYKVLYDKSTEDLRNPDRDICDMGAMAAKPTIWVLGQLLFYHLRSNPTIEAEVQKRVRAALEPPSPLPPGSLTLAMHIRSGMDKYEVSGKNGRKSLGISRYMDVLDEIQARLVQQGRSLGLVYLSSHLPAMSYVSTEFMTKNYPRPFQYSTLPRIDTGKEETEITAFKAVANGYVGLPPLKEMYIEYLADIHIMIEADIYIGAFSNVYGLAGSMRMAKYPQLPLNHTCFLDIHIDPPPLMCEGTANTIPFWKWIGSGGFDEVTSFFSN